MGRTVPSFRNVLAVEKKEWKPFRDALAKKDRRDFDEMWDIPRLYISACSNSVQLVPLQPIIISILFHHYKELKECILEVEEMMRIMEARIIKNDKDIGLIQSEKEEKSESTTEVPITTTTVSTTLDSHFIKNIQTIIKRFPSEPLPIKSLKSKCRFFSDI